MQPTILDDAPSFFKQAISPQSLKSCYTTIFDAIESPLPFDIICDPSQSLYKEFEIGSVAEKADLFDEEGKKFIAAIKASGEFPHGKYEGDELQLPASFVVDRDLNVVYSRYGKRANDVISPDDLASVLAQ